MNLEFRTDALRLNVSRQPVSCPNPSWSLFSFSLFSISSLSAIVSPPPCLSPLSFPVTGNSHNCRPKRLSVCRRQRGQAWLRLNAQFQGEFVSHGQTKDAVPHHRGATYTANRRSRTWMQLSPEPCLWSWQLGKNVRPTTAANQGWLIWSFPFMSFKVLLVTAQTAGGRFLWPQGSSGSLWRTWKVGLDGWWDKPDQTLLLRLDTQTWESGRCRCLLPVTNFWIVQEAEPSKLLLNNPRVFFFFVFFWNEWKHLSWHDNCQIPPGNFLERRNWRLQIMVMFWNAIAGTAGVP